MDNRIWSSGASATPPTPPASPSSGYPSPGNPALSKPATKGGAFWFHQMGEELRNVLAAAGIAPSSADLTQLLQAILIVAKTSQIVGKNKLLNTNFENPVNQLGKATRVTTTGAYNFDQWYYGSDSKFYQPADYVNLSASQQYTLSWAGTATAEYKFATVRSSGIVADAGTWTAIASGGQTTTPADVITGAKFLWIRWTGVTSALATFDKPQLEEGAFATTYERKLYAQVLGECQGYLPLFKPGPYPSFYGFCQSATAGALVVPFPVSARFAPTGVVMSLATANVYGPAGALVTLSSFTFSGASETGAALNFGTASGLAAGASTALHNSTTTPLYFTGAQI